MIPEIGHFALVLALGVSICLAVFPMYGYFTNQNGFCATAKPLALLQGLALAVSFGVLMYGFLAHDFSIKYVADNSAPVGIDSIVVGGRCCAVQSRDSRSYVSACAFDNGDDRCRISCIHALHQ